MARFFGRHEHSLDPKGRVILPAKFRQSFERGAFLTKFRGRCLALWTTEAFEAQSKLMEEAQNGSRDERNLARLWAAGTEEVDVDRQGRLAIAPYLREYARLVDAVLVNGAMDRVELWNPEVWVEKVAAAERRLTEEDDE
ncbi:MAG TPA: division/cell wall cluster transcriptional repressor MraZ [Acidimicrobiales bacterium]|nr:division/cell wall cluster transcriptional repressor MraZ [Acidimicrobiales bacterium]